MSKYISRKNTVSSSSLKRKSLGAVVIHHSKWEDVRFVRVNGGWLRSRTDFVGLRPEVVSSSVVADECNRSMGCAESWAKVY